MQRPPHVPGLAFGVELLRDVLRVGIERENRVQPASAVDRVDASQVHLDEGQRRQPARRHLRLQLSDRRLLQLRRRRRLRSPCKRESGRRRRGGCAQLQESAPVHPVRAFVAHGCLPGCSWAFDPLARPPLAGP